MRAMLLDAPRTPLRPKLPLILGHQIVATVEQVGEGVDTLSAGDRVGVPWLSFPYALLWGERTLRRGDLQGAAVLAIRSG